MKFNHDLFWAKIDRSGECWEWTAYKDKNGYGRFRVKLDGRWVNTPPYRVMWWLTHGVVPVEIDHLCKNPGCVNPDHLEDVSHTINLNRSRRDRCRRDHDAWYIQSNGRRRCRTCVDMLELKRGRRKAPPRSNVVTIQ